MTRSVEVTNSMNIHEAVVNLGTELDNKSFGAPSSFSFRWAGLHFIGRLIPCAGGTSEIELDVRIGFLPYSGDNSAARQDLLERLSPETGDQNSGFRIRSNGEVKYHASTVFSGQLGALSVAHCLTATLLHLRNHLKQFDGLLIPAA